jgi:hypothetical protein
LSPWRAGAACAVEARASIRVRSVIPPAGALETPTSQEDAMSFQRLLTVIVTVFALCGWILTTPTRALAPSGGTTTQVLLPVYQYIGMGLPFSIAQGNLNATFEATLQSNAWVVRATFKPSGLTLTGALSTHVSGKATGSTVVATGASATIVAAKLNLPSGGGSLIVVCQISVDPGGVVSVQQYHLEFRPPNGGSGGQQGGDPCVCN